MLVALHQPGRIPLPARTRQTAAAAAGAAHHTTSNSSNAISSTATCTHLSSKSNSSCQHTSSTGCCKLQRHFK